MFCFVTFNSSSLNSSPTYEHYIQFALYVASTLHCVVASSPMLFHFSFNPLSFLLHSHFISISPAWDMFGPTGQSVWALAVVSLACRMQMPRWFDFANKVSCHSQHFCELPLLPPACLPSSPVWLAFAFVVAPPLSPCHPTVAVTDPLAVAHCWLPAASDYAAIF